MLKCVHLFYNDIQSCVLQNGFLLLPVVKQYNNNMLTHRKQYEKEGGTYYCLMAIDIGRFGWFFKCTSNVQLNVFQWKLIHKVLPTNSFLKKKLAYSKHILMCRFCKTDAETILHVFIECQICRKSFLFA